MLGIGEFSHTTGLAIKTLRYYHDIGLLPAAHVDDHSGYRSYDVRQAPQGVTLRLLRAAGMGVAQMKEALNHPPGLHAMIEQRRKELQAQRELEDWALAAALAWQGDIDTSVVEVRACEPRAWVGVETVLDLNIGDDEEGTSEVVFEELQSRFDACLQHLLAQDSSLAADDCWLTLTPDAGRDSRIRLCLCLGVPAGLSPAAPAAAMVRGELPRRTEAFVRIPLDGRAEDTPASRLPGGPLPPAASLALAQVADDAGLSRPPVRQRTVLVGEAPTLECSLTLREG